MKLADDQIDIITSFADGADRVMRALSIDRATLEELLLDSNVERCKNIRCRWYDESSSMLNDEGEPDGFCENCRKYECISHCHP